jgi:transcriptional regulatory protein LevR
MENSPELKALIRKNAHLFWYTKDTEKENLPLPVVVEFFLNYADAVSVKELFQLQGIKKIKKVFEEQLTSSERVANNYNPLAKNFYTLYFAKYAS